MTFPQNASNNDYGVRLFPMFVLVGALGFRVVLSRSIVFCSVLFCSVLFGSVRFCPGLLFSTENENRNSGPMKGEKENAGK